MLSRKFAILVSALASGAAVAQTPSALQTFEVASVRLAPPGEQELNRGVSFSGRQVNVDGLFLRAVVSTAYEIPLDRVTGPQWVAGKRVVIHALMPEGATRQRLPEMFKNLLKERFHLVAHFETLEDPAFALTKGKGPLKLTPAKQMDMTKCSPWTSDQSFEDSQVCRSVKTVGNEQLATAMFTGGPAGSNRVDSKALMSSRDFVSHHEYFSATMQGLASILSVPCGGTRVCPGLSVVDQTGIDGIWDLVLDVTCSVEGCSSQAAALEKIGLKLEKTTAPIRHLLIDHIDDTPTEN